jgi:hypothetical protein
MLLLQGRLCMCNGFKIICLCVKSVPEYIERSKRVGLWHRRVSLD